MDVVIIGGGVNGLVAAAWMASRKLSVTVIEQHERVGGAALTLEFVPGFKSPTLSHALGPISRDVLRALRFDKWGIEFITPDPSVTAVGVDHQAVVFHRDPVLTAASITGVSKADAARWSDF